MSKNGGSLRPWALLVFEGLKCSENARWLTQVLLDITPWIRPITRVALRECFIYPLVRIHLHRKLGDVVLGTAAITTPRVPLSAQNHDPSVVIQRRLLDNVFIMPSLFQVEKKEAIRNSRHRNG